MLKYGSTVCLSYMSGERFDTVDARIDRAHATAERTADNIEMLTQ
jgi:hypothetical protein